MGFLIVFLGGGIGAASRHGINLLAARMLGTKTGFYLLLSQGVCTWTEMSYEDGQCSLLPTAAQKGEAAAYKISSYGTVKIVTNTIKTYLASNKPVIVAGPVNMAFEDLGSCKEIGKFTGTSLGGHCYCVVGYDDSKSAFEFQNSWGTYLVFSRIWMDIV